MKLVSKEISDHIYQIFDKGLSYNSIFEKRSYLGQNFSVFDHWLSIEECVVELPPEGNKKYEEHLAKFYKDLYVSGYKLYCYIQSIDDLATESILSFRDLEEYMDHVILSIEESIFMTLIILDLRVFISGASNYTHPIFYNKDSDMQEIRKIVKRNELFFLD